MRRPSQRPEKRADDRQRASVRQEGHDSWDFACDVWKEAERQAEQMGRGFPSATLGDGGSSGSGGSSVVEREAFGDADDPGVAAAEWLNEFTETRAHLTMLAIRARNLLPIDRPKDTKANEVAVCKLCELPNPKVKRIDGIPYCATTCYFKVWRSKRAAS